MTMGVVILGVFTYSFCREDISWLYRKARRNV
jgi:hypothetical protein